MTQQEELQKLLHRVSPSLKKKVQGCMFQKALEQNDVIKNTKKNISTEQDEEPPEQNQRGMIPKQQVSTDLQIRTEQFLAVIVDNLGTELPLPED